MKKISTLFLLVLSVALTACSRESVTEIKFTTVPEELKDCKFFELKNPTGDKVTAMRCLNNNTSLTVAKDKSITRSTLNENAELTTKDINAAPIGEAPVKLSTKVTGIEPKNVGSVSVPALNIVILDSGLAQAKNALNVNKTEKNGGSPVSATPKLPLNSLIVDGVEYVPKK